jgi:hypothetical protein
MTLTLRTKVPELFDEASGRFLDEIHDAARDVAEASRMLREAKGEHAYQRACSPHCTCLVCRLLDHAEMLHDAAEQWTSQRRERP